MSNQDTPAAAGTSVMAKAEREATVEAPLDLNSTILIGFVGKSESPEALLRNRDGSVERVARGEQGKAGKVIGIDQNSVRLQKNGKVTVLRLPRT